MRTIMIADDEKLVRVGLQSIVNWEQHGYEIIGAYKNGEEAWEAVQERCPDILLTDIRMPRMDGISLIAQLKKYYPHVHVVILSSYEDFEYTRKAIQLNVRDYLIKHELEADELMRVLNALNYPAMDREEAPVSLMLQEKQKLLFLTRQSGHEIWRNEVLLANEIPLMFHRFGTVAGDWHVFYWLSFRELAAAGKGSEQESKALSVLLEETLERFHACLVGFEAGTYLGFIRMTDLPLAAAKQEAGKIVEEVQRTAKDSLNTELICGLSKGFHQFTSLPAGRKEAANVLESNDSQTKAVFWNEDLPELRSFSETEWIGLYHQVKNMLGNEQFDQLVLWIRLQFQSVLTEVNLQEAARFAQMIAQKLIDLLMEKYQVDLIRQNKDFPEVNEQLKQLQHPGSNNELLQILIQVLQAGQAVIGEQKEKKRWIMKTYAFIEANYRQPLRLEQVARHVSLSENYFSQRFHQETGSSFSDYLMTYRIEKAKELFLDDRLSTEEIADRVGYANPNYFIRVFKKITGITVSEYRRK